MHRPALRQDLRADPAAPRQDPRKDPAAAGLSLVAPTLPAREQSAEPSGALPQSEEAPAWARPRRLLLAALVVLAFGLMLGFLRFIEAAGAVPETPERPTEGIVVLTGGADRVRTALALLAEGKAGRLLVSGAHRDVTLADLAAVAGQPVQALQARVTLGHSARSTRGNAAETAAWARAEGITSIRLVTAGYHMPRATLELRRALPPEVAVIPHPVMPPALREAGAAARVRTWTLLCGEYAKLIGAALGLPRDRGA